MAIKLRNFRNYRWRNRWRASIFGGGGTSVGINDRGQFFIQFEANGMVGSGAFAGVGIGVELQPGAAGQTLPGLSTNLQPYGEINIGEGIGIGIGGMLGDGNSYETGFGREGVGFGIGAGIGVQQSTTIATPSIPDLFPNAWLEFMDFISPDPNCN